MNVVRVMLEIAARAVGLQNIQAASTALSTVKGKADDASASLKNLAGAFTSIVVGQYLRRGLEALIKPAADFDLALRQLRISSGAAGEGLKRMEGVALKAAERYPYTPLEAVKNLNVLRRSLGNTEEAIGTLDTSFGLAMASFDKISPEKAAVMMASMARGFGMSSKEINLGANQIFALTKVMGTEIQDFSEVMGSLGVAAMRGGQSFQEMVQAFALVRNIMPSSKQAATQLVRAMGELGKPKTREALYDLGIEIKDLTTGKILPASEIFLQISESMNKNMFATRDALTEAFGERSTKAILSTLAQLQRGVMTTSGEVVKGADAYAYMTKVMKEGSGALGEAQQIRAASTEAALKRAEQAWWSFRAVLGEMLAPAVGSLVNALTGLLNTLRGFAGLPIVKQLLTMGLRIWAVKTALFAVRLALFGVRKILTAVTSQLVLAAPAAVNAGTAMTVMGTEATVSAGLIRGRLIPAVAGLKLALKGLWSLTGIGLIVWLPEIIGGLKSVWHWMKSAHVALRKFLSEPVKNDSWLGYLWALAKRTGAIALIGPAAATKAMSRVDVTLDKTKDSGDSLRRSMQDGAKAAYDFMHMGSNEMEAVFKEMKGLSTYEPKPIDFAFLTRGVEKAAAAATTGVDKTTTANMGEMLRGAKDLAQKAQQGTASPKELTQLASRIGFVATGLKHFNVMSSGALLGKKGLSKLKTAEQVAIEAGGPAAQAYAKRMLVLRGGAMMNEPGTMLPGYQSQLGWTAASRQQTMIPGMARTYREKRLRKEGMDITPLTGGMSPAQIREEAARLGPAGLGESVSELVSGVVDKITGYTPEQKLGASAKAVTSAAESEMLSVLGSIRDLLRGELNVIMGGGDPFLGSSASVTNRGG